MAGEEWLLSNGYDTAVSRLTELDDGKAGTERFRFGEVLGVELEGSTSLGNGVMIWRIRPARVLAICYESNFSEVHTIGLLRSIIRLYSNQSIHVILPMVSLHCLAMGKHTWQAFLSRTQFSHAGFSAQISFLISCYTMRNLKVPSLHFLLLALCSSKCLQEETKGYLHAVQPR